MPINNNIHSRKALVTRKEIDDGVYVIELHCLPNKTLRKALETRHRMETGRGNVKRTGDMLYAF